MKSHPGLRLIAAFVALTVGHSVTAHAQVGGTLVGWGLNHMGQTNGPIGDDFVVVSAGSAHGLALRADGSLAGWGRNGNGQASVPAGNDFVAIAAGGFFSLAVQASAPANFAPLAVASIIVGEDDLGDFAEIPCDGQHGALVTLDGSASSNPDGDGLDFEWSAAEDSSIVMDDPMAAVTEALFPVGGHEVTLTVYDLAENGDRKGELDVTSLTIVVTDETPPSRTGHGRSGGSLAGEQQVGSRPDPDHRV